MTSVAVSLQGAVEIVKTCEVAYDKLYYAVTLGSAQTCGFSLYSSGAPLPVCSVIEIELSKRQYCIASPYQRPASAQAGPLQ